MSDLPAVRLAAVVVSAVGGLLLTGSPVGLLAGWAVGLPLGQGLVAALVAVARPPEEP